MGENRSLERINSFLNEITETYMEHGLEAGIPLPEFLRAIEIEILKAGLKGAAWNQSQAGKNLGMPENRMRARMQKFGIKGQGKVGRPRTGRKKKALILPEPAPMPTT